MIKFFLLALLLMISSSLRVKQALLQHFKQNEDHKSRIANEPFPTQQALKLYNKDSQIQQIIQQIIKKSPHITKQTCSSTPSYSYLIIDVPDDKNVRAEAIPQKKEVIITCNIHARQLITTQICLEFLKYLSNELSNQESLTTSGSTRTNNTYREFDHILQILTKIRLTVYYRGNDLRDKVINEHQFCIRKDLNNIDINRNFPTNFNYFNQPKWNDQYPGKQPLSQPFSQCLDNYFQNNAPDIYMDIHSGQFTLFYENLEDDEEANQKTLKIFNQIITKYCQQCRIAAQDKKDKKGKTPDHSNGQIFTDVKLRYKADFSVLFQVFGGFNSQQDQNQNCFTIFNPRTRRQLDYQLQKWSRAIMYFVRQSVAVSKKYY